MQDNSLSSDEHSQQDKSSGGLSEHSHGLALHYEARLRNSHSIFSKSYRGYQKSRIQPLTNRERTIEGLFPRPNLLPWPTQSRPLSNAVAPGQLARYGLYKATALHVVDQNEYLFGYSSCCSQSDHYPDENEAVVSKAPMGPEHDKNEVAADASLLEESMRGVDLQEQTTELASSLEANTPSSFQRAKPHTTDYVYESAVGDLSRSHASPQDNQDIPQDALQSVRPNASWWPFRCKIKRVLGETDFPPKNSYAKEVGSGRHYTTMTDFGKLSLASQILCSPLPKLMHLGLSPEKDIQAYLASPNLRQRVKIGDSGRVALYSQVGNPRGKYVFIFPGLGYTRFIATFWESTASVLGLCLIVIDAPGQSCSEQVPSNASCDIVAAVDQVCAALKVNQFSILAHTTGFIAAMKVASSRSEKVIGSIVLLSPYVSKIHLDTNLENSVYEPFRTKLFSKPRMLDPFRPRKQDIAVWSSSEPRPNDYRAIENVMARALWCVSTNPINPKYDISLLSGRIPVLHEISHPCKILHQVHDDRVPISYARKICEVLPKASLLEFDNMRPVDLIACPRIMAEVLESIKREAN